MEHLQDLPRAVEPVVARALRVFPVVVLVGPRQVGKSTLARRLSESTDRLYLTLDDLALLDEARRRPDRLLGRAPLVTIDEVQRAPELLLAMKRDVDLQRRPGRFLVTGSADVQAMKSVADHLPGRAVYLNLEPLSRAELRRQPTSSGWEALFTSSTAKVARSRMSERDATPLDVADAVLRGGFPIPARLDDDDDRRMWFDGYVRAWLERLPDELGGLSDLPDLRRLMGSLALRLGNVQNQADVARDAGLARTTAHRQIALLSVGLLFDQLPAFARSRGSRLIKSPKVYWRDAGLAAHLVGVHSKASYEGARFQGPLLENLILANLRAWVSAGKEPTELLYWRTSAGREVDFVVERDGLALPIEVKSARRVSQSDIAHLEAFLAEHPKTSRLGVILYSGETVETPAPNVVAVPFSHVL